MYSGIEEAPPPSEYITTGQRRKEERRLRRVYLAVVLGHLGGLRIIFHRSLE